MLSIFTQYSEIGYLVLTIAIGVIFDYHAWPKVSKPEGMATGMGWSPNTVRALGIVEMAAATAMILGIQVQFAALALALVMAGAIYTKITKWKIPFNSSTSTGWEFDLILLAANIFLLTNGM